jgi:hypothetical protein
MTLGAPVTPSRTTRSAPAIKPELLRLLDTLPRSKQTELLNFARSCISRLQWPGLPRLSLTHRSSFMLHQQRPCSA